MPKTYARSTMLIPLSALAACQFQHNSRSMEDRASTSAIASTVDETVGFSWTTSTLAPEDFLKAATSGARAANSILRNSADIPDTAVHGHGLYLATDPLQSSLYGRELHCVSLRPGTTWQDSGFDALATIHGPAALLRYPFAPGLLPQEHGADKREWAGVVRDASVIDFERSRKISFSRNEGRDTLPGEVLDRVAADLDRDRLCDALAHFEGNLSAFSLTLLAASPQADLNQMTVLGPMLDFSIASLQSGTLSERNEAIVKHLRESEELVATLATKGALRADNDLLLFHTAIEIPNAIIQLSEESDAAEVNVSPAEAAALINAMGLAAVPEQAASFMDLKRELQNALRAKFDAWGKAHAKDADIGRRILEQLERKSLRAVSRRPANP